jgi:2'-5' RNA ligase
MRLFIAIDLPDEVKDALTRLRADISGAAWVRRDGYHLTLKFLGDGIDSSRLQEITATLAAIDAAPFEFTLRGVGRFPPRGSARVLWVGVSAPPALATLQQHVESAMASVGFPPEARAFSAHITLARLKSDQRREVEAFLERHRAFQIGAIPAARFHLVESTLTPQGASYQHRARFDLKI